MLVTPPDGTVTLRPAGQKSGEGLGIWTGNQRRGLLDASLEMASSAGAGTTFRVVFPENYSE